MELRGKGERMEDNKSGGMAERIKVEVGKNVYSLCEFCHLYLTLIRKILKKRLDRLLFWYFKNSAKTGIG